LDHFLEPIFQGSIPQLPWTGKWSKEVVPPGYPFNFKYRSTMANDHDTSTATTTAAYTAITQRINNKPEYKVTRSVVDNKLVAIR
jgi:hypothetical protein